MPQLTGPSAALRVPGGDGVRVQMYGDAMPLAVCPASDGDRTRPTER
ncbi:hypothetical protein [Streptomyces sp. MNP-20]|nr:hypothetical protein [Streptomyces sp. MNP-20]